MNPDGGKASQDPAALIQALQEEMQRTNEEVLALTLDLDARSAQLERANQELEAFAYSVSHDLRAPLRHLSGYLGYLSEALGPALEGDAAHCYDRIVAACESMDRMIAALMEFSRLGRRPLTLRPVSLDRVLAELVDAYRSELTERQVAWLVEPLPVVHGDSELLRTVFRNLLDNAVKFTGRRAQAVIQVGCAPAPPGEIALYVRDNGAGFDPAEADKLFGVFQRLHPQDEFSGTGIGLARVQRIMQRHGGRIWAEAQPDQGATFYLAFPAPGAERPEPSPLGGAADAEL
jgi:light-regulated signal transduction histidine kinase (bacteriophytochrome)